MPVSVERHEARWYTNFMLNYVVAKSENGVIGANGDLPWHLPADLKHFRDLTLGHTVVMGRKTFESIVARLGTPLPGRTNVVVTRNHKFAYPGVEVVYDTDEVLALEGDIYNIGGAELYRALFDRAQRLYVTQVHCSISGDAYFPSIDPERWRETDREEHDRDEKHLYGYDFVTYERASSSRNRPLI